ncbi:hypothetical protein L7F22_040359 [Adiantum nelumboides]|nr:hypothetical protein [Adiantum nelumboides]
MAPSSKHLIQASSTLARNIEPPLHTKFCRLAEEFHKERGLPLEGVDPRSLTRNNDISEEDWEAVFICLKHVPGSQKKVTAYHVQTEFLQKLVWRHWDVYQEGPFITIIACLLQQDHAFHKEEWLDYPRDAANPGMEPALEAESAVGNEVCGEVEDILMAKSAAVKSPRQQLTPRRLLRSLLSAKASPSVDTRDEASDEVVANAVKATPPPAGKKPTPKRKKSTPKKLDNQEAQKRRTYTRRTRSSRFLDEGSIGSLALSYLEKNPRGGATASRGVTGKKRVSFDIVEGSAGSLSQSYPVVHDDVHTDVDHGKLEKGTLPTPTTVESGIDAIVDAMVVDACTDVITNATIVNACTNDIVDAMEVDASTNSAAADGNVNDGGIESIVHAVIDGILDAIVAMGTDAIVESSTDAILDASTDFATEGNVNDGGIKSIVYNVIDAILDTVVAMGTDATVESGTDAIFDAMVVDACTDAMADAMVVVAYRNDTVDAMEVDASTDATVEVVCPSDAADDMIQLNEAGTKNADKEAKNRHEDERQERVKCLVVMPVQIVALPPVTCEEKKRRDNLCIILDMNGLLIRRYKVSFYKGIARSSTLDWARSKYQVVVGTNVTGKMQFEYVVRPNASNFLDALLQRAQVALWSSMTQDNLAVALSACFPRLNKQLFLDIIGQEGC